MKTKTKIKHVTKKHWCRYWSSANLELVDKFRYVGGMLSVDGDADAAVEAKIWIGWNKFRQLVALFTSRDISLIKRGRLYSSCVRNSMLHGSETWPVRKENEVALQQAEMRMVRWMCTVKVKDRVPSKELRERLGIDDIILVLQENRLRWYGHVLQKGDTDWVKKCMEYEVKGSRPRGRPKRTWTKKRLPSTWFVWSGRMLWIIADGRSLQKMDDDQDSGWVNVSS